MADECFKRTVDERRAYLKLAHVWLEAALAEDDQLPELPAVSRLNFIRPRASLDNAPQPR
jgi:hypothetical protein